MITNYLGGTPGLPNPASSKSSGFRKDSSPLPPPGLSVIPVFIPSFITGIFFENCYIFPGFPVDTAETIL
jgi:hypothetical protein